MKNIVFIICLLCLSVTTKAQYTREDAPIPAPNTQQPAAQDKKELNAFWKHVAIGGGFELQFGEVTLAGLSPLFNYRLLDNVEIGIGPIYQYFNVTEPPYGSYTTQSYGGRICGNIFLPGPLSSVFVHGEYDIINVPDNYGLIANITRATLEFPMAGLGYKRAISDKAYYYIEFSYNFNNSNLSPYFTNPVMEAGFDFGL